MKPLDPRLLRHARASRTLLAVCVGLGTVTAVLVLAQAELLSRGIARIVDGGRGGGGAGAIAGVLVALAAVVAVRALVAWAQDVAAQRAAVATRSQLRRRLVAHVARRGVGHEPGIGRAEAAMLAGRGLDALDGYFGRYLPQLVLAVIVPVAVVARLLMVDPTAAAVVVLTLPLIPVFMVLVGRATEAANARRWRALGRLSHHFLDVVTGLPTLKAFGRAKAQGDAVRTATDRYRATTMKTLRIAFLSSLTLELLATLSVALVAVSIGLRLVDGAVDLRTGLLVIVLAPEAYLPIRQVGAQYHASAEGIAAADIVLTELETVLPRQGGIAAPDLRRDGELVVDGLRIVHRDRMIAAPDGVTLRARPGRIVAVVGPSGSGKTTLLAAILGFVAPTDGIIGVDTPDGTVDLALCDPASWRAQIAWVPQRPYLAVGTLEENVRLSRPDAPTAEVRRVLAAVGLGHLEVDRAVGERGEGLSAGEQRRVAIARALLRGAPLLLLDEPTAGLDDQSERDVLATVTGAAQDAAVVLVTHRPAAIAIADTVVEITSGAASPGRVPVLVPVGAP